MFTLKAPAKINWFLKILGPRGDGYHDIESLIQKITLYDTLAFVPSKDLILLTDLQIPVEQNLVYKAALLLKKEFSIKLGIEIRLNKNIPVAAGLGGGSSDAASTLLGLNEIWSLGLSNNDLCVFAEQLGSDVPFFLHKSLAFVEGKGEKITNYKTKNPVNILLVTPPVAISTQWAYENFKPAELTKITHKVDNTTPFIHAVINAELQRNIHVQNDLESVAVKSFPVIAEIKERLFREGAILALMSGSGPTVFGVFESAKKAKNTARVFKDYWTSVVQNIVD